MSKPLIDIVIPTAGRFDMLEKCLDALYREAQTTPINIFVIDDFSPAEERIANTHLFEYQPDKDPRHGVVTYKTKRFTQSMGFGRTCNEGAREGKAPLVMFLNDDVELLEGAIDKILRRMDDNKIGTMGIKLMFPPTSSSAIRPPTKVQHIGIALDIRGFPQHPLVGWRADHPKCNVSREAWAVTGACLITRRSLWNKIGGFDAVYGKGTYEDVEYCLKTRQSGGKVFVDTEISGWHYTGATVEKKQENYPLQMNQMIFASRWAQSGQLMWDEWSYY